MMPSRSPRSTRSVTPRTATSPPNRLVTPSSASTRTLPPRRPRPTRRDPGEPVGREADDEDQRGAVDDEIDPGESGLDARERRAQVRLERRDQDRAEERAEGRPHPADDRVEREADREVHG